MGLNLNGYLFGGIVPFNLIKGVLNGALTFTLYKRMSSILKEAEHDAESSVPQ